MYIIVYIDKVEYEIWTIAKFPPNSIMFLIVFDTIQSVLVILYFVICIDTQSEDCILLVRMNQ